MKFTRREFIQGGVTAFTVGFAAPAFLSDLARAQGTSRRNLVVLYLGGGNDALSTVAPYQDPFYYSRRPTLAIPPGNVLQVGTDAAGRALGLHPRLSGLKQIFDNGDLALMLRTGYPNSSRSHFTGTDIWNTADPINSTGNGWLGRYLDTLPSPIDPLAGWVTVREIPRALYSSKVAVPAIPSASGYAFQSPNTGTEVLYSRNTMNELASHLPDDRPHLSYVNATASAAIATLDKVGSVGAYVPTVTYANNGLSLALRDVAGAMVKGIGTKVFWVTTGGYDTHATQNTNAANAGYANLMGTINAALLTFYTDLSNQGLLGDTLILQFSEFGRRITENGSNGTDHGAAGVMMAIGSNVNGGLFGTAPDLNPFAGNPTLENNGADVTFGIDFRSVYARVIDNWLGSNSVAVLGGDFRRTDLGFI